MVEVVEASGLSAGNCSTVSEVKAKIGH